MKLFSAPTKPEPTTASSSSSGPIDQRTKEDNPAAATIISGVSSVMTALTSMISRDSGIDVTSPSDSSLRDQQLPVDPITPGISVQNSRPAINTGPQKVISVPPSKPNKRMGLRDIMEKEVVRAYLLSQCLEKGFRPSGCDVAYSIKKGLAHKKLVSITDCLPTRNAI